MATCTTERVINLYFENINIHKEIFSFTPVYTPKLDVLQGLALSHVRVSKTVVLVTDVAIESDGL